MVHIEIKSDCKHCNQENGVVGYLLLRCLNIEIMQHIEQVDV